MDGRKGTLWLLALPLWAASVLAEELWLVELEHNDGIRLQFQGAELELGSAALHGVTQYDDLRPGMRLAILSNHGVAEQVNLTTSPPNAAQLARWRRAEDALLAVTGHSLQLQTLGTHRVDEGTRWRNGGPADLRPGLRLVLSRDEEGRLTEILFPDPDPEDDPGAL